MSKQSFQGTVSGAGYGYVYVMSYPGSDKVKIGHSLDPSTRATAIGGTLAPETPVLEAYFWCSERREDVERAAHRLQAFVRANGEWFSLSVGAAVDTIRRAANGVGVGIQLVYDRNEWEAKAAAEAKLEKQRHEETRIRLAAEESFRRERRQNQLKDEADEANLKRVEQELLLLRGRKSASNHDGKGIAFGIIATVCAALALTLGEKDGAGTTMVLISSALAFGWFSLRNVMAERKLRGEIARAERFLRERK